MSAIQYVIRDGAGLTQRGAVNEFSSNISEVAIAPGDRVSLNLRPREVVGYEAVGEDLELLLVDGRRLVLDGFFNSDGSAAAQLYLNEDGHLLVVNFDPLGQISYEEAAAWGKWSELDALVFPDDPMVEPYLVSDAADAAVHEALVAGAAEQDVATQAIGLGLAPMGLAGLGTGGAIGAAGAAGAAVLSGTALIGGAMALLGGDGSLSPLSAPSVDAPNAQYSYSGTDAQVITITGTATPGSTVDVVVGGETVTVVTGEDGTWEAEFSGEDFPADGSYDTVVEVTNPDGSTTTLDGPTVVIDTVAPAVDASGNIGMAGSWINAEAAEGGVVFQGTGEPGAAIQVKVEGVIRTTTVASDGSWSVQFAEGELPAGEYTTEMTVTATDAFGNQTVRTETLAIDTVSPALDVGAVAEDNIVNGDERLAGVAVSGTAEPGAVIVVSYDSAQYQTTANGAGNWSVTFAPGDFAEGDYEAVITAVATDQAGNRTVTTSTLHIDTAGAVTIQPGADGGETVVNTDGVSNGIELTGHVEPGSEVVVEYDGTLYDADVDENGTWTVTIPAEDITSGEYDVEVTVTATDPANNVTQTTSTITIDTETQVTVEDGFAGQDLVIGAGEADAGVTISGTAEPGATVDVDFEGSSHQTVADENGNWSVDFAPSEIPEGDYDGTLTVTVTDTAGNTASETITVPVDTTAHVAFAADPVAADGIVNFAEAGHGIVLTGTTIPGSVVTVTDGTHSYLADVAPDGSWSVNVPAAHLPSGETDVTYTANAISPAGNLSTSQMVVRIDTVTEAELNTPMVEDNVISGGEREAGVTLTGMAEPGSIVIVKINNVPLQADVADDGSWTVTFPTGALPQGEIPNVPVTVIATDLAGNTTTVEGFVSVDTITSVEAHTATMAGDGVINAAEADDGVILTGTAEPGATVSVTMNNVTHYATAAANGAWAMYWPPDELPRGEGPQPLTISSTDLAGNTTTIPGSVHIDTLAPESAHITSYNRDDDGNLKYFSVTTETDDASLRVLNPNGTIEQIDHASVQHFLDPDETILIPNEPVPDGSHLLVTRTDAAGNTSTNLLVLDEPGAQLVDLSNGGLGSLNIDVIDLREAVNAELTISADTLAALSKNGDTLVISGAADDVINIDLTDGASYADLGQTVMIGTNTYNVHTLGDLGGTLLIEEEIDQINTIT